MMHRRNRYFIVLTLAAALIFITGFFVITAARTDDVLIRVNAVATGNRPEILSTGPANSENQVQLYRPIEITLNHQVPSAQIEVVDKNSNRKIPGQTNIVGNKVLFVPTRVFLPTTTYKVIFRAETGEQVKIEDRFSFNTINMGNKLWVEIKLGHRHSVTVFRGKQEIRHMLASGGKPESPTPTGYFYSGDRGYSFWSARFGEGATYWVRLAGQILVHSVPRDSRWKTKEEEHAKLGLPASHGCVRLDEKDAKWFFENIPPGTLVIIHP